MPLAVALVHQGIEWGDAAAWAQALAATVALGLALRQGYEAAGRERERERSALHSAYGATQGAAQAMSAAFEDVFVAGNTDAGRALAAEALSRPEVRSAGDLLLSFDLTRLGSEQASGPILMAQLAVLDVYRGLGKIKAGDTEGITLLQRGSDQIQAAVTKVVPLLTAKRPRWWERLVPRAQKAQQS